MQVRIFLMIWLTLAAAVGICGQHKNDRIAFVGTVTLMSPANVVLSGDIPSYRLVKYKISKMYKGRLRASEVVVDHLIVSGKELASLCVGDKVKVVAIESPTIDIRTNYAGIRNRDELVKSYYIAKDVMKIP